MARRFDQIYRVKPRDNLGDPEYWNRRFEDLDRRVSSNEAGLEEISGLTGYVEGLALNRLNLILEPALDKIALVSEEGFLLAHSDSVVTLDTATTQVFAIPNEAERKLFTPSPFVTLTRAANMTDYAFCQTMAWDRDAGQLTLKPLQIFGNPGPFDDWVIYVGTAISAAVQAVFTHTAAARDLALAYRDAAAANAAQTSSDKTSVTSLRNEVLAARDAAAQSAANAALWDPSSYSTTSVMNAAIAAALVGVVDGAPSTLNTINKLAVALGDANFGNNVTTALANRLRVDIATQGLTGPQQSNGRANLGLGSSAVKSVATVAEILNNTNGGVVTVDNAWQSAGWVNLGNLSGSVTIDCTSGCRFRGVLVGNVTINFSNQKDGQSVDLGLTNDAAGNHTVSWGGNIVFPDSQAPLVYTGGNAFAVMFSGLYSTLFGVWFGTGWKIY
jgi:hypothetical protein